MTPFAWGLVLGLIVSGIAGAVAALLVRQRVLRLQQRARSTERLAELVTLTGGLAHEIKNPLSTVGLNLQLAEEDLDPADPHQQRVIRRLQTVQREAHRLREILDDFLRFAGKMELDLRPVDLNALLEEVSDFFAPQASLQKVTLRVRKADKPVVVALDARLIQQLLLNLMINAVQAMPAGGELILSAAREGTAVRVDVIDTGQGIPPEVLPNIFQAYYSTKKSGTGLGLAISQRVAAEHGGSLTVSTQPGKGTDFVLRLPASDVRTKSE